MHILIYLCIMSFLPYFIKPCKLCVLILSLTFSGVSFISFGKLYCRHFFCCCGFFFYKFVFYFECVYTSKFPCIVIVDMCVTSYITILQLNRQTSFIEFKVEFQLL